MIAIPAFQSSTEILALRLKPGQDLKNCLIQAVLEAKIEAGFIVTCVGSLTRAAIRLANSDVAAIYNGHFEIVSLTGTVSIERSHLHISLADTTGKVVGGHLLERSLIYTTAEVVIGIANDLIFSSIPDKETGYVELDIRHRN